MDCSQEHVFWSTPLNSQSPFFSETIFIQTTQTYVVTVCGFVTFEGQLATFKDSSPKQSNYVDNGYQNSATFQGTRIKHTQLNFRNCLKKGETSNRSLYLFDYFSCWNKQYPPTKKQTSETPRVRELWINITPERRSPSESPGKKRKERKKEALYILIDSLDFLIKG